MTDKRQIIQEHNDRFRAGDEAIPGQILVTQGLAAHMAEAGGDVLTLHQTVAAYDQFGPENDPHGEHDFGSFDFLGERCFWKLDLYNPTLDGGTDDPTDLEKTFRVLTIMLAQEY